MRLPTTTARPRTASPPGACPRRPARAVAAAMLLVATTLALVGAAGPAAAQATVGTEAELRLAWADPSRTSIVLAGDIELTECTTPQRTSATGVTIDGSGHTLVQGCAPTALEALGDGPVTITDLTVRGPLADGGDPAQDRPALALHGHTELDGVEILGAAGPGVLTSAPLVLDQSVVRDGGGAGIAALGNGFGSVPWVACRPCRVERNAAAGIDTSSFPGAEVSLVEATVEDNGGVGVHAGGEVAVGRSTIASNAEGILAADHVAVIDSTITYNSGLGVRVGLPAVEVLGQPRADELPELSLVHATVVANGSGNVAAPVIHTTRTVLGSTTGDNCEGTVHSGSWNFADDATCALDGTGDVDGPTAGPPGLGDLADNGGPTRTRYPAEDSPLVGAVPNERCLGRPQDQRGFPRPASVGAPCDIGAVQSAHSACASPFVDVGPSHPFCGAITWLADEEGARGWPDGTYRPGVPASRQALAAFLWRLWGEPDPVPGHPTFVDVPAGHPFHDAISWLAGMGFAEGYDDGTFRPTDPVSRQAAAALLRRSEGLPDPVGGFVEFSDVGDDHAFHDDIEWLAERGAAQGYDDGTFRPGEPTSRQAMAAFLHRRYGAGT